MNDPDKKEVDISKAIEKTEFFMQDWIIWQAENYKAAPFVIDAIAEVLIDSKLAKQIITIYELEVIKRYKGE